MFAYAFGGEDGDLTKDTRDNAAGMPKSVVVERRFDWAGDANPRDPAGRIRDLRGAR